MFDVAEFQDFDSCVEAFDFVVFGECVQVENVGFLVFMIDFVIFIGIIC